MTTKYWLDDKDIITKTNIEWDQFAIRNNGIKVLSHRIIGQSLFAFIQSSPTRMFVETLISRARITNSTISKEYRCDSPRMKRFMKMNVIPLKDRHILVDNQILKEEPLANKRDFITSDQSALQRCSICNRMSDGTDWFASDDEAMALYFENGPAKVHYTVCSRCRNLIRNLK